MRRCLVFILLIILWGLNTGIVGWAAEVSIIAPEVVSKVFNSTILVDVGSQPLGAFEITIYYNPKVVSVSEVQAGKTKEFSRPLANINNNDGVLFFTAFQAESLESPTGLVNIANINFKVIGDPGDKSPLSLEVNSLVGTDGGEIASKPVSGRAVIIK